MKPETIVSDAEGQAALRTSISPRDVGIAAEGNPVLYAVYQAWRSGAMGWDQAMMHAAVMLARQNATLCEQLNRLEYLRIPDPVKVAGVTYVYTGPCPLCGKGIAPKLG